MCNKQIIEKKKTGNILNSIFINGFVFFSWYIVNGMQVQRPQNSTLWTLQIKYPQLRDAGLYECQLNTEPKMSLQYTLNIIGKCFFFSVESPCFDHCYSLNNTHEWDIILPRKHGLSFDPKKWMSLSFYCAGQFEWMNSKFNVWIPWREFFKQLYLIYHKKWRRKISKYTNLICVWWIYIVLRESFEPK